MAPDNITIMEGLLSHANESGVIEYKGINPGKTIAFIACIHGNEIAWIHVVEWLRTMFTDAPPLSGTVRCIIANHEAFFHGQRYRATDLNRIWNQEYPKNPPIPHEFEVRERIRPWLEDVDVCIDIHSTTLPSASMVIPASSSTGNRHLCEALSCEYVVHNIVNYLQGSPIIAYHANLPGERISITIEGWQHSEQACIERSLYNARVILERFGYIKGSPMVTKADTIQHIDVLDAYYAQYQGERLEWIYSKNPKWFDVIPKGTIFAKNATVAFESLQDSVLLFPQKEALHSWKEMFFLGSAQGLGRLEGDMRGFRSFSLS